MRININKFKDRFCFEVGKFSSLKHFYLSKFAKSSYQYPYQAYSAALKFMDKGRIHVEAMNKIAESGYGKDFGLMYGDDSAEEIMFEHYDEVISIIKSKTEDFKNLDEDEAAYRDKKRLTYEEIKLVITEILTIKKMISEDEMEGNDLYLSKLDNLIGELKALVHKHYDSYLQEDVEEREGQEDMPLDEGVEGLDDMPLTEDDELELPQLALAKDSFNKFASLDIKETLDEETLEELMVNYGEKACSALVNKHPNCNFKLLHEDRILIYDIRNGDKILVLQVNRYGNLEKVLPSENCMFPLHSAKFYQKYWKPVVSRVGHIYLDDHDSLVVPSNSLLPDTPKMKKDNISAPLEVWDAKNKDFKVIDISFSNQSDPIWIVQSSIKKEGAYQNKEAFRAIDPELDSIFNKVGYLVEEYEFSTGKELAIDFGRNIVRLTPSQIEEVSL